MVGERSQARKDDPVYGNCPGQANPETESRSVVTQRWEVWGRGMTNGYRVSFQGHEIF